MKFHVAQRYTSHLTLTFTFIQPVLGRNHCNSIDSDVVLVWVRRPIPRPLVLGLWANHEQLQTVMVVGLVLCEDIHKQNLNERHTLLSHMIIIKIIQEFIVLALQIMSRCA